MEGIKKGAVHTVQLMLHSCNPMNIIKFQFGIAVLTQANSHNRYVVVSNLERQVIIHVTLENDANVIVGKYHSPVFDDGLVQMALFNSPAL